MGAPLPRMDKPRLMLVEPDVARRLEAVSALASRFDVVPVAEGEDPLRVARTRRPDIAVLSVQARRPDVSFRLCRTLRTDLRPVGRVGIVDRTGRPRPPGQVLDLWLADGYLAGEPGADEVVAFVEAVWRGERPVRCEEPRLGPLARLLGRLRG